MAADPDDFDLAARASQVVVLSDVSLQLFIADAQRHRAVQLASGDHRHRCQPAATISAMRPSLPADDGKMFMGELTQGQVTKLWQINLVRRLDNPDGSFAGVIAASYDTNSFIRFYREVDLGASGLIAVVSMRDGDAWTLAGPTRSPR